AVVLRVRDRRRGHRGRGVAELPWLEHPPAATDPREHDRGGPGPVPAAPPPGVHSRQRAVPDRPGIEPAGRGGPPAPGSSRSQDLTPPIRPPERATPIASRRPSR